MSWLRRVCKALYIPNQPRRGTKKIPAAYSEAIRLKTPVNTEAIKLTHGSHSLGLSAALILSPIWSSQGHSGEGKINSGINEWGEHQFEG
jgi:hypothetical protein